MSLHSSHRPYESVFEKDYDVVIYGAGYIGLVSR
jgi:hypothetical protein